MAETTPNWLFNLRRLMAERKISPRRLSLEAGLNSSAVRDILDGRSRSPRYSTIEALSKVLRVSPASLMEEEKDGESPKTNPNDEDEIRCLRNIAGELKTYSIMCRYFQWEMAEKLLNIAVFDLESLASNKGAQAAR